MDDISRSKLASWLKRTIPNPRLALYIDAAENRIMDLKELTGELHQVVKEKREPRPVKGMDRRTYMRKYMQKYRGGRPKAVPTVKEENGDDQG